MILFALEHALRAVWAVLKAHDSHGYLNKDQDLQKAIADKLMALADSGVTDPQNCAVGRSKTSIYTIQPSSRAMPFDSTSVASNGSAGRCQVAWSPITFSTGVKARRALCRLVRPLARPYPK